MCVFVFFWQKNISALNESLVKMRQVITLYANGDQKSWHRSWKRSQHIMVVATCHFVRISLFFSLLHILLSVLPISVNRRNVYVRRLDDVEMNGCSLIEPPKESTTLEKKMRRDVWEEGEKKVEERGEEFKNKGTRWIRKVKRLL